MKRLVCNPTIQYIIISLHTKYDYPSLHSLTAIFDEKFHHSKYGKKENWTNTGKDKHEKAGSQSHDTIHHYHLAYRIDNSSLHSLTAIFDEKFHYSKYGKKENQTNTEKNKHENRKENPQKLTQFNPTSYPRHPVGKRTAQNDAIKDITSDSQVSSYFPYRWPPASLTINSYFTDFYIYI